MRAGRPWKTLLMHASGRPAGFIERIDEGDEMSEALATQDEAAILEAVVVGGDLKKLQPLQRLEYYRARCRNAGLDPLAQPFQFLELQGKLVLYATKAATDQLAASRNLCIEVLSRDVTEGDIYEVVCRVRDSAGRVTEDIGAVYVGGMKGEALANARKKGVTQAKRRSILAHCGLGMLDETETEGLAGAVRIDVQPGGEIEPPVHDLAYWRKYAMALYQDLGGDPGNKDACRADIAKDLGIEKGSRKELTAEQWERWARHLRAQREDTRSQRAQRLATGPRTRLAALRALQVGKGKEGEPPHPSLPATAEAAPVAGRTASGWKEWAKAALEQGEEKTFAQQQGL